MTRTTNTNALANLLAKLAMAGRHVVNGDKGDYTVCKYGMSRFCADFAALQAFAVKLGVVRHD